MLSMSSEAYFLEEADSHIQENLEDEVVQEALKSGVDLREYSRQVEDELREVENHAIQDYIGQSQNIATLHNQIVDCDQILERMENMLKSFQNDLGSISNEILSLQQQSVDMNLKLKNRQAVRGELSQFVDDMVVSEQMIMTILETPVTEQEFLEELQNLEQKINFLKEQSFRDARSCNDVKDVLEKLKIKAVYKIREFLLEKVNQFKKPLANYQIPQNIMHKFKFYFQFLLSNNRNVAKEVKDEYVDTVSKMYFSYFKSYSGRLAKLHYDETATRDDLMGLEDSQPKGFFSKPSLKSKATVFSLGSRGEVLTTKLEAPIIVPHAQQKTETKFPYECLFRSEQYALMDNACREYCFLSEFFIVTGNSAQDLFNQVFGRTLQLLSKNVDQAVSESYDSISLFLCIHLVHKYRLLCHKHAVPAMDRYWDTLYAVLWPRLERVMQLNIQSIRECDPQRMKTVDMRPHYITRRYAEFNAAFVSINEDLPEERMYKLLAELQQEVENFVLKMASVFVHRKDQLIFLINNYDVIISVLVERSQIEGKDTDGFQGQLSLRTSEYVEEVLQPHFGAIISFIKEAESLMERSQTDQLAGAEKRLVQLIQDFNNNWKKSLDSVNQEVLSSFPNFKNGTSILQQILTQFVQYYHRFHKILSLPIFNNLAARRQLINIHQLMVEVKKYKPSF